MAKYRVVYENSEGATFSAPVELRDGAWVMHTSDGFELPINFHFTDDAAGRLTFSHYREEHTEPVGIHVQTGSSWADHKQAHAEQRLAVERKQREQARTEIQNVPPDAAKVAQARDINNQLAHAKKPNGRGVGIVPE
jgi:hypothetical protein